MRGQSKPGVALVALPPMGLERELALGLCYLATPLRRAGMTAQYFDLAEGLAQRDEALYEQLIRIGFAEYADGVYDLCLPLYLEVLDSGNYPEHSRVAQGLLAWAEAIAPDFESFDVAFLTLMNGNLYSAAAFGRALRARGIRVAAGGPAVRAEPVAELLLRTGAVDAVLQGEGETRAVPLAMAMAQADSNSLEARLQRIGGLRGLAADGGVWKTPLGPPPDIREILWPDFDGTPAPHRYPALASRGCTFSCSFCSERFNWGDFRRREVCDVVAEIAHTVERFNAGGISFRDDLLNSRPGWLQSLAEGIVAANLNIRWDSYMVPYGFNPPLIDLIRQSGCNFLKIGIQSFSPGLLRRMHRPPNTEAIHDAIAGLLERGIGVAADIIVGHPSESEDDHRLTLDGVARLAALPGKLSIDVHNFALFYGTGVHQKLAKYGAVVEPYPAASLPSTWAHLANLAPSFFGAYRQDPDRETVWRRRSELEAVISEARRNQGRALGSASALASGELVSARRTTAPSHLHVRLRDQPASLLSAELEARRSEGAFFSLELTDLAALGAGCEVAKLARGRGARRVTVEAGQWLIEGDGEFGATLVRAGAQTLRVYTSAATTKEAPSWSRGAALSLAMGAELTLVQPWVAPARQISFVARWASGLSAHDAPRIALELEAPERPTRKSWSRLVEQAETLAGRARGLRVKLGQWRHVPICLRPKSSTANRNEEPAGEGGDGVFAEECAQCVHRPLCPGLTPTYAARRGTSELLPTKS